jgi:hypothetical protein
VSVVVVVLVPVPRITELEFVTPAGSDVYLIDVEQLITVDDSLHAFIRRIPFILYSPKLAKLSIVLFGKARTFLRQTVPKQSIVHKQSELITTVVIIYYYYSTVKINSTYSEYSSTVRVSRRLGVLYKYSTTVRTVVHSMSVHLQYHTRSTYKYCTTVVPVLGVQRII